MGCMTRLRCLSIAHNRLEPPGLPPSLWGMASLEHLLLGHNQLTELPGRSLAELTNLQSLDLRHNRLAALPPSTTCLSGSLTKLVVSYNNLTAMPPRFMDSMDRLAVLVLDFNPKLVACPQLAMGRPGGDDGSGSLSVHNSTSGGAGLAVKMSSAVTLTPGGSGSPDKGSTATPTPHANTGSAETAPAGAAAAAATVGTDAAEGTPFAAGSAQAPVTASVEQSPDRGTPSPLARKDMSPSVSAGGAVPATLTAAPPSAQPSALGLRHSNGAGLWRQVKVSLPVRVCASAAMLCLNLLYSHRAAFPVSLLTRTPYTLLNACRQW